MKFIVKSYIKLRKEYASHHLFKFLYGAGYILVPRTISVIHFIQTLFSERKDEQKSDRFFYKRGVIKKCEYTVLKNVNFNVNTYLVFFVHTSVTQNGNYTSKVGTTLPVMGNIS